MKSVLLSRLREVRQREDGLTIAEVLVAFSIIIGVLLATAMVMGYAFTSQSTGEGRDRAVQVARDRIEETRQVSFSDMAVTYDQSRKSTLEEGLGNDHIYNGEQIAILPSGYESTLNFPPYEEVLIGQYNFRVWTYITKVKDVSFDGTFPHLSSTEIHPKRLTVVVKWDSPDGEQEVVQSWIRTPYINECIPTIAFKPTGSAAPPIGCQV